MDPAFDRDSYRLPPEGEVVAGHGWEIIVAAAGTTPSLIAMVAHWRRRLKIWKSRRHAQVCDDPCRGVVLLRTWRGLVAHQSLLLDIQVDVRVLLSPHDRILDVHGSFPAQHASRGTCGFAPLLSRKMTSAISAAIWAGYRQPPRDGCGLPGGSLRAAAGCWVTLRISSGNHRYRAELRSDVCAVQEQITASPPDVWRFASRYAGSRQGLLLCPPRTSDRAPRGRKGMGGQIYPGI